MEERTARPTIEDVANACGVSVSTVSRVINKSSPVSRELNRKVRKTMQEMGFTPRQWQARATTDTIAILIPYITNPFYAEVIKGAQEEAERLGLNLLILNMSENPRYQKQQLTLLGKWDFDGLIVMGSRLPTEDLVELYEQHNMPIVAAVRAVEIPQLPCIMFDYTTPAYQAARHLLDLNHQRIAYISGPPEWHSAAARRDGIVRALTEMGLSLPDALYRSCFPNMEEGFQTVSKLLNLPREERPTAIIAFDDLIAIGALHAIRTAGLQVPGDISVIGFDDIAMAAYTNPPLTTVAQPKYRMGQLSVKKLFEMINGRNDLQEGGFTLIECPLVARQSTAPCPE
jgi:LacI family transcriptional regulator